MKNLTLIILLLVASAASTRAQNPRKSSYSREISMNVDNDIFFVIDYYYTAGQDLDYRRLLKPTNGLHRFFSKKSDTSKVIFTFMGGFKIFTPTNLDHPDTKTMDRPYAGWSYARAGISNFPSATSGNRYEVETGLVGKFSRIGELQRWVHQITDFEVPHGWDSQIRNEFVVNTYYTRYQEVYLYDDLDIVSQSAVQAGTGGNKISQDFTVRAIKFNSINNSYFAQSRLNWDVGEESKKHNEIFLFFGVGVDYVLSNIFLEGSLFNDHRSVFTVPVEHWVLRRNFGIMFSSRSVSWNITTYHLSKESPKNSSHDYASLGMAVRF